jgi:predicted ester cyclase
MIERIQGAMRALLASTIVQSCDAVDEKLAHWLKEAVAARRERTWRHHVGANIEEDLGSTRGADKGLGWGGMRVSAEENKALVREFFEEAWVKRNPAAVDMSMAAGYVEHAGFPNSRSAGRDGLKQLIALYHGAFPDLRSTVEDMFAEGDRVAYRWTARGTHLGEWAGISPTGNHMTATGMTIFRVTEGKIVEGWVSLDLRRSDEDCSG